MRSLSIAATGMLAQQMNVEVISNNIANVNTTGFKRQRAEFQDLLYQDLLRAGTNSSETGTVVPSGIQIGLGVKPAAVYRITEQGNITITNNELDMAINGKGYFPVELPSGDIGYTRAGSFGRSPDGDLVTPNGFIVQPGLTIPTNAVDVSVNAQGQISVTIQGQTAPQVIGQLQLATFANEAGLRAVGDNLFMETTASGIGTLGTPGAAGFGTIQQGALETSNVNVVSEITNLITAQRAYEMNSRVIQASDEMLSSVVQLR
ncbi:MAG: flagellar basal-body rod protein FlgG [Alphaproteobacteria bacterium]|nr:flagellar basal-body rod protein FlgG [Alphaproteobacteria bacterium]